MIKPTLFVGLGTTGTEILKKLRTLMSEEFEDYGLPLFRYISIETKESETGDNPRHTEDYERITVINATIEDTNPIKNRLDSNHPHYNEHLTDWLNSPLLDHIQSFRDGASNIRMAGRLCLWENWTNIQRTLTGSRRQIIDPANADKTLEILNKHYESKGLGVPDPLVNQNGINAYVVGTLCGGSCSGMLIDMAYYLRKLLGDSIHNKVYGIFTMFDRLLAEDSAEDIAVHAANCFACLSELNYYNYENTPYKVTFPSSTEVNTIQKPFDYAMFVSPTGKLPNISFVADDAVDVEGLNLMVALNLFAEAAGDTDSGKEAIRTDWIQFSGFGGLKPVPVGETPTMVKCLASFGLTAIWYPKYRIASAAACSSGQTLCENWLKGHKGTDEIKADAKNEWENLKGNSDILSSPLETGRSSLVNEIKALLNTASHNFNNKVSADDLKKEMDEYPPRTEAGDFATRFSQGGKYHAWMVAKVENCKKAFCDAIDLYLVDQLNKIDFQGTYGLGDVRAFFAELDQILKQAQQECPSQSPVLNLSMLKFEPMRNAKNIWTKIAGTQEDAVKAHRGRLIQEYRQLIEGKAGIYRKVRDYFLRNVLQEARAKLGFEVQSDSTTISQQLNQIEANLKNCNQILQKEYVSEIEPPRFKCVKIVTNNPQNSIEIDADALSKRIIDDITPDELLVGNDNPIKMDDLLKKEHADIILQMTETFRRSALRKINVDADDGIANALVVTKAQEILNAAGDDIKDLVRRSNPYQAFIPGYKAFDLSEQGGTKIIFGHDPTETDEILSDLETRLDFGRSGNSSVDHLLFFYEEEASFALDDLASYKALKQHFDKEPGVHGHSTHQEPNYYDLTLPQKMAKLKRWCDALVELVPEIRKRDPNAFNDVFQYRGEAPIFRYRDVGGLVDKPLYFSDDERGIKNICRQENEAAYSNFFDLVKAEFTKIDAETVTQAVSELTEKAETLDQQHDLSESYSKFLQEVYPDGVGPTPPTSSSTTVPDQPTSEVPTQSSKETTNEGSETGDMKLVQQVLAKPVAEWTEEDRMLIQRYQQNMNSVDDTSTGENGFEQDGESEETVHS